MINVMYCAFLILSSLLSFFPFSSVTFQNVSNVFSKSFDDVRFSLSSCDSQRLKVKVVNF